MLFMSFVNTLLNQQLLQLTLFNGPLLNSCVLNLLKVMFSNEILL